MDSGSLGRLVPKHAPHFLIHDRMPVIVSREDWEEWFSPGKLAADSFLRITTPYRAEEMSAVPISPLVNSAVDDPRCCQAGGHYHNPNAGFRRVI